MNKLSHLKKRKWLKNRQREKRIKKQQNYKAKTHKGTGKFDIQENIRRVEREKQEEKLKIKRMEGMFK